jgi:6-phosphofructokinase 1
VGKVYAARNGIIGALREELIDTGLESPEAIDALATTPGAAFGSCRFKLKSLADSRAQYERLIEVFRAHDIRWFLYNGGNDSADTSNKVSQIAGRARLSAGMHRRAEDRRQRPRRHRHLPGLRLGREVHALSILEASLDVQSMFESSTKVFVMEVMGRHAGWIAAAPASRQGRGRPAADHPVPRGPVRRSRVPGEGQGHGRPIGYCSVVVSEGVKTKDGRFLAEPAARTRSATPSSAASAR